jgi:hypothetical protein
VFNKRDANEPSILAEVAKLGVDWTEAGPLDGWIYLAQFIPVEIKMPGEPLTTREQKFIDLCIARDRPWLVWRTSEQAVDSVIRLRLSSARFSTRGNYG